MALAEAAVRAREPLAEDWRFSDGPASALVLSRSHLLAPPPPAPPAPKLPLLAHGRALSAAQAATLAKVKNGRRRPPPPPLQRPRVRVYVWM